MEALKDKIPLDGGNTLTVDIIIDKVCDRYGVTKEQVLSNARPKNMSFQDRFPCTWPET